MPDAFLDIRIIKRRGRLQHVSDVQISEAVFLVSLTIFSRDLWCAHFYLLETIMQVSDHLFDIKIAKLKFRTN